MRTALLRLTNKYHKLVTDNSAEAFCDEPCVVGDLTVSNPNTSEVWIQIFDKANSGVTVGTTTPDLSYPCPPGDGTNSMTSTIIDNSSLTPFVTGFTFAITTTRTGSTAPSLDVVVNGKYRKG